MTPRKRCELVSKASSFSSVVMADGSVAQARVVRSLDPVFGLDQQAVKSLEQWRFRPGMKDGTPVPALPPGATVPGASVKSNRDAPAPVAWPDAFGDASTTAPATAFADGAFHQPTFELAFAYPSTWSMMESSAGITLHADDESGTRAVTISSPQPTQFSLTEPVSQSVLDSFTVSARAGAAFITNPRVIKSGQVRRDGGLWIWFEMAAQSFGLECATCAGGPTSHRLRWHSRLEFRHYTSRTKHQRLLQRRPSRRSVGP